MNRLRELRLSKNLTTIELGKLIHLDPSMITHIEKGKKNFSTESLQRACEFFKVSADYMLGKSAAEMYNGFVKSIHDDYTIVTLDSESGAVEDISAEVDPVTRAKLWVLFTLQKIEDVKHIYEVRDYAQGRTAVEDFPPDDASASPEAVKLQNEVIALIRQIKNTNSLEVLLALAKERLATEGEGDKK